MGSYVLWQLHASALGCNTEDVEAAQLCDLLHSSSCGV
jgi:hypothetical protein